jgi:hypothetical protein
MITLRVDERVLVYQKPAFDQIHVLNLYSHQSLISPVIFSYNLYQNIVLTTCTNLHENILYNTKSHCFTRRQVREAMMYPYYQCAHPHSMSSVQKDKALVKLNLTFPVHVTLEDAQKVCENPETCFLLAPTEIQYEFTTSVAAYSGMEDSYVGDSHCQPGSSKKVYAVYVQHSKINTKKHPRRITD